MTVWATDGTAPEDVPANRPAMPLKLALQLSLIDAETAVQRDYIRRLDDMIAEARDLDARAAKLEGK